LADKIPRADPNFYECRFTTIAGRLYRGEPDAALTMIRELEADTRLHDSFSPTLSLLKGQALEAQGHWKEALACYSSLHVDGNT
ncbi:MAG: hypothetical protein GWM93_15115, partial [Gemmatimonadetes bacterium]|nr:hypothetical protein [Gemmatimonadota bacterium]NIY36564.1 hypothetical protein [Gemmatimonadota bacterium]